MSDEQDQGVAASPPGHQPTASAAVPATSRSGVPNADYAAMCELLKPMIDVAYAMPVEKLVAAMRGFYATTETNCPWYAYGLRHAMPPILATIGQNSPNYEAVWFTQAIEARQGGDAASGSVHESAVAEGEAP